jgi:integrase
MKSLFVDYSLRYNRKNQLNTNGEAVIQVRMYLNGQTRYYSTGIYINPSEWNLKKNLPKDHITLKKTTQLILQLETYETDYRKEHTRFTLENFDDFGKPITQATPINTSFSKFMTDKHQAEKVLNQSSWRVRRLSIELFRAYKPEVAFLELNNSLIEGFEYSLRAKKLHTNTIEKHHKHIKKYILKAITDGFILQKDNPYLIFKPSKQESKRQGLAHEELGRFEKLTFGEKEVFEEKVRDMFLFGVYTGLRFMDIYRLKNVNFLEDSEEFILDYQAGKTLKHGKNYLNIMFGGKGKVIANKYMPEDDSITLFKGCTNPKVNKVLKTLAKRARIPKSLCFKDSRNTFVIELMLKGVPLSVIQELTQHSSLAQMQHYIKLSGEMTKNELSKIKW